MATTHIHTQDIPRSRLDGQGEVAEILNEDLCGAENVIGKLHWLNAGERLESGTLEDAHQLFYLMEGEGTIHLEDRDYDVAKGAGLYLGPSETASIGHRGNGVLKLFHLTVPIRGDLQLDA